MKFLRVENQKTGRTSYFVDDKRVTKEKYDFKEEMCQRAGMRYNTSYTEVVGVHVRHFHHYSL